MPGSVREYAYWGRRASRYGDRLRCVVGHAIFTEIETWLGNQFVSTDAVLELGCGPGTFTDMVVGKVKHLTATDLAPEMVGEARNRLSRYGNLTVQTEDCYGTSFEDAAFDAVLLVNVLHIVEDPVAVLAESHRVLRDDGRAVVVDVTGYGMSVPAKIGLGVRYCRTWGRPCLSGKNLTPESLAAMARKAGFQIRECRLVGTGSKAVCLVAEKTGAGQPSAD